MAPSSAGTTVPKTALKWIGDLGHSIWLWVKTNGIPFWDRCTTHCRTYFSGDWDVHWGYDLDFDPCMTFF